ncbi:MAG TPA: hypothetical protein VMH22_05660 [bacterium]|nr:hypothetical protein [bacterium]
MSGRYLTVLCVLLAGMTVPLGCKSQVITVTVPSGPETGHPYSVLSYTSSATSPSGDSVAIRFDWGDGDTSAWSGWLPSGGAASDSHSWSVADTFLVRAQAKDADGHSSDWSNPLGVAIAATWTKTFGGTADDEGFAVVQAADHGYVVAGHTYSYGTGAGDIYVIKTDAGGSQVWSNTFGSDGYDAGYAVAATSDGYVIAGTSYNDGMGASNASLIKVDSSGNRVWGRSYGFLGADVAFAVQPTSDGGYILAGQTGFFSSGGSDVYLVKTDAEGNQLWYKNLGGPHNDVGRSVHQTGDGGYIILGETDTIGSGLSDMYLIKTDASGNQVWARTFGGGGHNHGYSVQIASDGGYILAGQTEGGAGGGDVYLVKTDASGNQVWAKTYGGSQTDGAHSIQRTADGGYIIAGMTASFGAGMFDVYLLKIDANGDTVWTRTYGGASSDVGDAVQVTSDGGYIVSGMTSSYGAGGNDVWLIKTDAQGEVKP